MNVSEAAHLSAVCESEQDLVARAGAGDEQAFRAIYRAHARYVAGVVFRMLGGEDGVDDIVQETFSQAALKLHTLADPRHLRRWLVTIAVRRAGRRLRRRKRQAWLHGQFATSQATSDDPRGADTAEALYQALEQIPARFALPWRLSRIEGERLEDVAAIADVSLATVKRRIAECQRRIERRLARD